MKSRLDDLLATADRQLAAGSCDAAIDNYRTALGEPGASEAGVPAKLEAACRTRDEARGIAPPPPEEASSPVPSEPAAITAIEPEVEAAVEPPPEAPEQTPIEPPSFQLIEDNPALRERPRRRPYADDPPISILNPTLPPEKPGDKIVDAIVSVIEFFS